MLREVMTGMDVSVGYSILRKAMRKLLKKSYKSPGDAVYFLAGSLTTASSVQEPDPPARKIARYLGQSLEDFGKTIVTRWRSGYKSKTGVRTLLGLQSAIHEAAARRDKPKGMHDMVWEMATHAVDSVVNFCAGDNLKLRAQVRDGIARKAPFAGDLIGKTSDCIEGEAAALGLSLHARRIPGWEPDPDQEDLGLDYYLRGTIGNPPDCLYHPAVILLRDTHGALYYPLDHAFLEMVDVLGVTGQEDKCLMTIWRLVAILSATATMHHCPMVVLWPSLTSQEKTDRIAVHARVPISSTELRANFYNFFLGGKLLEKTPPKGTAEELAYHTYQQICSRSGVQGNIEFVRRGDVLVPKGGPMKAELSPELLWTGWTRMYNPELAALQLRRVLLDLQPWEGILGTRSYATSLWGTEMV